MSLPNNTTAGGVGYKFPPIPVGWLKRDLLLYSNSIGTRPGELHFLYELHPNFQAFPTYPVILSFKGEDQDVVPFLSRPSPAPVPCGPQLNPATFVDGERHIKILKSIPTSTTPGQFELHGKCLAIHDKGDAGAVLVIKHELVEKATGQIYSEVQCSTFAVGQGNWGGYRGPKARKHVPPTGAKPTATVVTKTSTQQALLYRLNGDYNPLHADPTVGKNLGFGGAILHGLCTWNIACQAVLSTFANSDGARLRSFGGRFASPVKPGDELRIDMWQIGAVEWDSGSGYEEVLFEVRVGERTVMTNGRALLRIPKESCRL